MAAPSKIPIHYVKSNLFRVVRGDGVYGGLTPQGSINMAFFSERAPYPVDTLMTVRPDGSSLSEEPVKRRKGFVREIEVGVTMDLRVAESFHAWLTTKIAELKAIAENNNG